MDKQAQAIAAVADANRTLEQKWNGSDPKWQVHSITLYAAQYDEKLDDMVVTGETLDYYPSHS